MIDERLAKGYARQMLREIRPLATATGKAIDKLYDNYSYNRKGQTRAIMRLSKKHKVIAFSTREDNDGTTNIIYWSNSFHTVENTEYREDDSLVTLSAVLESTRNGKTFNGNIMGPFSLCTHAIRRWIERDLTLPEYDLGQWLSHLKPIIISAIMLTRAAYDSKDLTTYLHRPVALPTLGGLFVGFMVGAGQDREDGGRTLQLQIAVRSFYGQHELDEDLQQLHARLLDDYEKPIAAHEDYGWDRLWQGQKSALLDAICRP